MKYITKDDFDKQVAEFRKIDLSHWGNEKVTPVTPRGSDRWGYHERAIDILRMIHPTSILEAGTMGISLSPQSDTIDIEVPEWGWQLLYKPTYIHDLTILPWANIKDKQYDVFVALRVFHHLPLKQMFLREMERIANHIILAFPPDTCEIYKKMRTPNMEYYFEETNTSVIYYRNEDTQGEVSEK